MVFKKTEAAFHDRNFHQEPLGELNQPQELCFRRTTIVNEKQNSVAHRVQLKIRMYSAQRYSTQRATPQRSQVPPLAHITP